MSEDLERQQVQSPKWRLGRRRNRRNADLSLDLTGEQAKVRPEDLLATVYNAMGIDAGRWRSYSDEELKTQQENV